MVYRQRVARVAGSGLVVGRDGLFLTLTAPGRYVHYVRPGQRCRCTPEGGVDLAAWNADAAARWNRLVLELSRWLGVDVVTYDDGGRVHRTMGLTYFRAAEVQRRGALHYHVLVRRRDGGPLALSPADLRRLALKHGFGHSVDVQRLHDGHATYVAKYVSKAANDRREVPWAKRGYARPVNLAHRADKRTGLVFDRRTGEVVGEAVEALFTVATYRTWAASRTWGLGMAAVRADQRHWVMTVSALASWRDLDGGVPRWWATVGGTPDRPDGSCRADPVPI
ncbi:replication initiator [Cellulomonas hominis]